MNSYLFSTTTTLIFKAEALLHSKAVDFGRDGKLRAICSIVWHQTISRRYCEEIACQSPGQHH